jgi:hypothetical protein
MIEAGGDLFPADVLNPRSYRRDLEFRRGRMTRGISSPIFSLLRCEAADATIKQTQGIAP